MCGIFYIDEQTLQSIQHLFCEQDSRLRQLDLTKDIHPSELAPVLIRGSRGMKLACQRWGYPGLQKTGVIFNARAESVREKKLFSKGITYHRAVIPAKHFYEWNPNREKNIFEGKQKKVLYLAGFFDVLDNEERFVILTTQANASMKKVHDRMPLILEEDQLLLWLWDDHAAGEILRQTPAELQRHAEFEQLTFF